MNLGHAWLGVQGALSSLGLGTWRLFYSPEEFDLEVDRPPARLADDLTFP